MIKKILVMNFGSTSTKVAIYENTLEIVKGSIPHSQEKLRQFKNIFDQKDFRWEEIINFINRSNYVFEDFDCVITRGGNCKPIPSGIYEITKEMLDDIKSGRTGVHPTGIGCHIAYEIGKKYNIPAIIADPPISDEFDILARYSGIKELSRISSFHVLNQKAMARKYSSQVGINYNDMNLIIVHMGGGISVAAHYKGRVIDANNALDGDGPFSAERSGTLPVGDLIKMCFSGNFTLNDMLKKVTGGGGLMSYLGTSSALEVEEMISNGDDYALEVFDAMAYQVAKEIGSAAAVLKGKVDAIIFTGGLANSVTFTKLVRDRVNWIAKIIDMPGENEMLSLAENANRYLYGTEKLMPY